MIKITKEEFFEETNIDLTISFQGTDQEIIQAIDSTLTRWSKILYREANRQSVYPIPADEKLNANQIQVIKESIINLGLYICNNGDPKAIGAEVTLPQVIIDDLHSCGLIRRGFSRRALW